ncbi:MAG: TolC family protein [Oligoflexia bacterium]|nr:TolC family protein [Oligoflexia bacterium]
MKTRIFFGILTCLALSPIGPAQADSSKGALTLREALDLGQAYSPGLKAARSRESQAHSDIGIAKSTYYPSVSAQAIDSAGFPGSTAVLRVGGLMGSPYRSGLGAGVVFTQILTDFGRTHYGVTASEFAEERQKQDTEVTRYQVDQEIIEAYFNCTLNQAQIDIWTSLAKDADVVAKEVNHFVQTGQRSIVDRYLAETQLEEAQTAIADFRAREDVSKKRLAVLIGTPTTTESAPPTFACPSVLSLDRRLGLLGSDAPNPFVSRAEKDLKSAQAQLDQAKADHLPVLVGTGSAGYLQDERLVNRADYSLGIGISIPLFEGFKISENVKRTAALAQEKDFTLTASRLFVDDYNQRYDETILAAATRLEHLETELKLARKAFDIAKKRYFAFQGDLLDVRAALSNLTRVLVDQNNTRAQYLQFKGFKEVLNGAH